MNERLKGKVAVITGAASGSGAATAKTYVEQGARVVLGDIQDLPGEALAASLGGSAHAVFRHCNVTNEAEVEALVEAAVSEFGQIDVMFNCAGIVGAVGPMSTTPADEWKLTIDIMVNGVFYGMKHASRHMKEAGSGSIISMSSTAGVQRKSSRALVLVLQRPSDVHVCADGKPSSNCVWQLHVVLSYAM